MRRDGGKHSVVGGKKHYTNATIKNPPVPSRKHGVQDVQCLKLVPKAVNELRRHEREKRFLDAEHHFALSELRIRPGRLFTDDEAQVSFELERQDEMRRRAADAANALDALRTQSMQSKQHKENNESSLDHSLNYAHRNTCRMSKSGCSQRHRGEELKHKKKTRRSERKALKTFTSFVKNEAT